MLVLNATTKVKSVMTDRGDLIQIGPGEFSRIIIASRNIIISAMNLGSPTEIGIVITGSYEMDIAKSITGCIPYLYTDQDEAKAKLLKADVDYKGNLNASKINAVNEELIKSKDEEILSLKTQLDNCKKELESLLNSDQVRVELEKQVESITKNLKTTVDERDRLKTQLQDSEDQIQSLTKTVNELRSKSGSMTQDLAGANEMISKLTAQLDEIKNSSATSAELEKVQDELLKVKQDYNTLEIESRNKDKKVDDLLSQIDGWKVASDGKDNQIKELSEALSEASKTIDDMKAQFNEACSKFNITKDDEGNWIQIVE